MALSDIYQKATLVQIPSGYKAADDKLYSVVPSDGTGDFTVDSDADATRVNKDGLIESVVADQARLDYNPTNPQDPTLLLEPERTNIITQSTELTSGSLAKVNLTVADNTSIVDPQGNINTKTLTATSTSQPRLEWRGTAVPTSNTSYAMSFWVRYSTARYVAIAHFSQSGEYAIFDLVDGAVESDVGTQTAKIEAYPNGWYRVSKSFEVPSTASFNYWKFTLCTQTDPFTGVSGEKADVFGLQLEVGSYATSLIPTSGIAATRTQDRCINGGDDALFNDSEGVLFADLEALGDGTTARKISLSDGSTDFVSIEFTTVAGVIAFSAGSTNNTFFSSIAVSGQTPKNRNKIAIKYKSGNTDCFVNGTKVLTRTEAFTLSGLDRVNFENRATSGSQNMFAKIHQLMVFNEALTDAELTTLTS